MFKKIIFLFALIFSQFTFSAQNDEGFVQGPFQIDNYNSIYLKKEDDVNYPLSLYAKGREGISKIDAYETNGGGPNVKTVFFVNIQNVKNIVILISWHQEHRAEQISGDLYQVYGYSFENGKIAPNKKITNDHNLSGEDGEFNGDALHFKYQTASEIKKYLKNKYN